MKKKVLFSFSDMLIVKNIVTNNENNALKITTI